MLITNFDITTSSALKSAPHFAMIMQEQRHQHKSSPNNNLSLNSPIHNHTTRSSTDFSIEAIMGRSNSDSDRPSPQLGSTAETTSSLKHTKGNNKISSC